MSNLKNRVQLIGHLGNDPEVIKFDSGKTKASFRLATNENFKNGSGEWVNETQWHNVIAWGGLVDKIERINLTKGAEIALQGKLTTRTYDDTEGKTRYVTEVNLDAFELLNKAKEKQA